MVRAPCEIVVRPCVRSHIVQRRLILKAKRGEGGGGATLTAALPDACAAYRNLQAIGEYGSNQVMVLAYVRLSSLCMLHIVLRNVDPARSTHSKPISNEICDRCYTTIAQWQRDYDRAPHSVALCISRMRMFPCRNSSLVVKSGSADAKNISTPSLLTKQDADTSFRSA